MQTKTQELAQEIYDEIFNSDDDTGDEIFRDLVDGVEPTTELSKWIEKMAEDNSLDEQKLWKEVMQLAEFRVALLDTMAETAKEAETA